MPHYYVTADLHLGHDNIIGYCHRPFRDGNHMNAEIIRRFNERVKPGDKVFVLGDFCFRSAGGVKAVEWLKQLNGDIEIVRGNHDNNNSAKTIIDSMMVGYGGFHIGMVHDPADFIEPSSWRKVDFNLVGHVHQHWKHEWRGSLNQHLLINVGVDVWNFYPVKLDEIVRYRSQIMKARWESNDVV